MKLGWSLIFWLMVYAVLAAAEFVIGWAKGLVEERIKGEPKKPEEPSE